MLLFFRILVFFLNNLSSTRNHESEQFQTASAELLLLLSNRHSIIAGKSIKVKNEFEKINHRVALELERINNERTHADKEWSIIEEELLQTETAIKTQTENEIKEKEDIEIKVDDFLKLQVQIYNTKELPVRRRG